MFFLFKKKMKKKMILKFINFFVTTMAKSIGFDFGVVYIEFEWGSGINIGLKAAVGYGENMYAEGGCYAEVSIGKEGISMGTGCYVEYGSCIGPLYAGIGHSHDIRKQISSKRNLYLSICKVFKQYLNVTSFE